jgi:hypothetical protein
MCKKKILGISPARITLVQGELTAIPAIIA